MPRQKKRLALSLPTLAALAFLASSQSAAVKAASDSGTLESPAQLRLAALDILMKGDKHNALDLYEESIRLANRQFGSDSTFLGDLYYEAGRLYLELDQFNQAEDYLRQAVKINPKNASARLALARLLDTRAKVQESIGQIREALLINPSSPVARQKFIQTLSKYGQSPSDKAIATQESFTLAMMQKAARDAMQKSTASPDKKSDGRAQSRTGAAKTPGAEVKHLLTVPTMPKNLVPLKEEDEKSPGKSESLAAQSTSANASKEDSKAQDKNAGAPAQKPSASSGLSLFPLKGLSARKEQEERDKQAQAAQTQAAKAQAAQTAKAQAETQNKGSAGDIADKIKEQARQHQKSRAAGRADKAEKARAEKAARLEAKVAELEAKAAKLEARANKPEAKSAKPEAKSESNAQDKQSSAKAVQQVQQPQQIPAQPMYIPQMMYPVPQFSAPPKAKAGKGFVPPPPPTLPMYPGMMPSPVMPQMIPQQQPKPAASKPKTEKPKPALEAKPADDKPPPMATTGDSDTGFILDWAEVKKPDSKKKSK